MFHFGSLWSEISAIQYCVCLWIQVKSGDKYQQGAIVQVWYTQCVVH